MARDLTAHERHLVTTIEVLAEDLAANIDDILKNPAASARWRAVVRCRNPVSEIEFSYLNSMILCRAMRLQGYSSPLWATYHQWQEALGLKRPVRRGQKCTRALNPKDRGAGHRRRSGLTGDEQYDAVQDFVSEEFFNAEQLVAPTNYSTAYPVVDAQPYLDLVVKATDARIEHYGSEAFFSNGDDKITLPRPDQFLDSNNTSATVQYYSTLLHELIHWTGHHSRMGRRQLGEKRDKKSPEYAFEELVAEFGASQLGVDLELSTFIRQDHVKYLAGYAACLRSDPMNLLRAVGKARQAISYLNSCIGVSVVREMLGVRNCYDINEVTAALEERLPTGLNVLGSLKDQKQLKEDPNDHSKLLTGDKWKPRFEDYPFGAYLTACVDKS